MGKMESLNTGIIINENKALKIENENLKKIIQTLKYENQVLNNKYTYLKNNSDYLNSINKEKIKELNEKCRILNEEKEKIMNGLLSKLNDIEAGIKNNNELPDGEKLVAVNFVSADQRINHSIVCNNKTYFNEIENDLYKKYPDYKEKDNYFMFNDSKIERNDTLEKNGIIGYTIVLNTIDNK